jgi:Permease for cytosine/purines, uracil, thiamine, allantoin
MGDFVHGEQADVYHKHIEAGYDKDVEAGVDDITTPEHHATDVADHDSEEVIIAKELQQGTGFLRSLRRGEEWLDEKMGIETQGIDRIKEEDKKPPSILNVFFLWWSLTCHVGSIPIGVLGPEFGLTLGQSVAAIVVGTMLGALCTSYTGTLGPKVTDQKITFSMVIKLMANNL